jgi:hypothetical protein
MQFNGRRRVALIAATTAPGLRQFVWQGNAAAILQDHCAEAPQQPDGHLMRGLHHLACHLLQHRMQELRALRREALVHCRVGYRDLTHLGRRGQLLQAGIGVLLPTKDQRLHQIGSTELALSFDAARFPR